MRAARFIPAMIAFSLLAAPAFARPQGPTPGKPPAAAARKPAPTKPAAKANKREARIIEALKSEGIDEARARKVVEVVKKSRGERRTAAEEMRRHKLALRDLLENDSKDEAAYQAALDGLKAGRKRMQEIRDREIEEVSKILKPSEQARVLKLIHKHRGKGQGRKHAGPRHAQGDGGSERRADATSFDDEADPS